VLVAVWAGLAGPCGARTSLDLGVAEDATFAQDARRATAIPTAQPPCP
jgi:hypothetical protein